MGQGSLGGSYIVVLGLSWGRKWPDGGGASYR
jgi:hypothetical protein